MNLKSNNIVIGLLVAILVLIGVIAYQSREETIGEKLDNAIEEIGNGSNNPIEEAVEEIEDEIDDATTGK